MPHRKNLRRFPALLAEYATWCEQTQRALADYPSHPTLLSIVNAIPNGKRVLRDLYDNDVSPSYAAEQLLLTKEYVQKRRGTTA